MSRRMIISIGQVNRLVGKRISLLRQGVEGSFLGDCIRNEAEDLLSSLKPRPIWQEDTVEAFRTRRIERGSLVRHNMQYELIRQVARLALEILLLCEVLAVDLNDPRVKSARAAAIELVADTEPQETAGYTWYLSVSTLKCRIWSPSITRAVGRDILHRQGRAPDLASRFAGCTTGFVWCWISRSR